MKKIYLDRLQNAEYLALFNDIIELVKNANINELDLIKTDIQPNLAKLDKGIIQIKKSEHTTTLAQLDKVRDNYLKGLRTLIKAEHFAPESDHQSHAKKVQILLDSYKGLEKENFRKQSELLGNLLVELQSSPYQTAVNTLNLGRWLTALQIANQNFITLYNQRRDEEADNEPINIKTLRQEMDSQYAQLINMLNALTILKPSEELTKLIAKINQIIEKWQETLAIRQGINKKQRNLADKPNLDNPKPSPEPIPQPPSHGEIDL